MQDLMPLIIRAVIIAAILIGVLVVGDQLTSGSKAETAVSQITDIASNIQKAYDGQADYSNLSCSTGGCTALIAQKAIPSNLVDSTGNLGTDGWGGNISIVQSASNPSQMTVSYSSLGQSSCIKVAEGVGGYDDLAINGTDFVPGSNPVTPTNAATACTTGFTNTLAFTFGK
ncbi:type 4 pilus major pilin [Acidiphilium sp. C61]|uniref:type 4 pilus major pilin n=1 Tax=Acidiphilium sp. C61 TaxID=1671485 RepID=UPI00157B0E8A|nr:type 4 pilus major pilin [Acidiphilium sp. C61]